MARNVTSMVAVIRGVEYDIIPGGTCDDCAFKASCGRSLNSSAPSIGEYVLCADIDVIFKKRKSK